MPLDTIQGRFRGRRGPTGIELCYNPLMDSEARERAERRRLRASQWPVRSFDLGHEPLRDPLDRSTVDERIAMMWPLAKEAWSVAGKPIANYERKDMPGALLQRQR